MNKSLYEILGVEPTATQAEIKAAYRKLAARHHPDKNLGDASSTAKFQAVEEAYRILKDAKARQIYDETGEVSPSEAALRTQAENILLGLLNGYFDNPGAQQRYDNFLVFLKVSVDGSISSNQSMVNNLKKRLDLAKKKLSRARKKSKGGEDIFNPFLDTLITRTASQLRQIEQGLASLQLASQILEDYEYTGSESQLFKTIGGTTGTSTAKSTYHWEA